MGEYPRVAYSNTADRSNFGKIENRSAGRNTGQRESNFRVGRLRNIFPANTAVVGVTSIRPRDAYNVMRYVPHIQQRDHEADRGRHAAHRGDEAFRMVRVREVSCNVDGILIP